ncbi:hypothetical protein HYDPIDRAFT_112934 [Hydnomerulius pinastri MD-312]|uniref:Heterokaryon incompatibility domain-containing protein n=1 Tax=Hydnomerulius pinastri MD-312 TaxID=994086 RepID=A0A0C9VD55_9AGAM|nr:hypothetical protein HYDPIDRAFT_112934 [Hydnomerulius pinastri MD-312]
MSSYVYEPLTGPRSIRLFDLRPGTPDDPLECSLAEYDLDSAPEYTAISYAWGDPASTVCAIICDGKRLVITENLRDGLVKVRDSQRPQMLWADRICINQGDVDERNHQVKLMGEIFRGAAVVAISLGGDEQGEEKETLAFVHEMVEHFRAEGQMVDWAGSKFILRTSPSRGCEHSPFEGLLRLFRRPWFSRTWVIQEHGLAKTAVAMFGDEVILFHYIGTAALILRRCFKEHLVPLELKQTVDMVWHLYLMFSPEVKFRNFAHLIDNTRPFQATDPRDKIYALLEHEHARSQSGEAIVEPDYRKTTLEVYREAAVKLIQHGQSIDILSAVQHDPDASLVDPDFPSWVPRFDNYFGSRVLGRYTSNHLASGNNPFPSELIPQDCESNVLKVRGIFFDTICSHTHTLRATSFDLTDVHSTFDNPVSAIWAAGKLGTTTATYPSGDTMKKAFVSTLTAGGALSSEQDFSAYWLRIFEAGFDPDECTAFERQYHHSLRQLAEGGSWMRFQDTISEICNARKFLFTSRGYFGLGPGAAQLDDQIVVLFGVDVPMLVRKREDGKYTLVGECYVHGIMAGKVVRTWRGLFPPGVGQPYVLNDVNLSQFEGAEPLVLKLQDIELR